MIQVLQSQIPWTGVVGGTFFLALAAGTAAQAVLTLPEGTVEFFDQGHFNS